jgi:multidrug efflux system outer membrane protein
LDFWGKFRRATESARADLLSQEWARRQVIRSLVTGVASAYFQLRELDLELEISRETLASRKDSLRLTQILADGGAISMVDVRQAEQLVYGAPSLYRALNQIEQQENFISTLLGKNLRVLRAEESLSSAPAGGSGGAAVISLQRRPDILRRNITDFCQRPDQRRQSGLLSSNLIDGHERLSELSFD